MISKRILISLVFILFILSCKKDKLVGDSEILIGKWNWSYSNELIYTCNPPVFLNLLTPETENKSNSIEFDEKGRVFFYVNNELNDKYWMDLIFKNNSTNEINYPFGFTVYLDGEFNNTLSGFVGNDSIKIIEGFPYPDTDCENYVNYFVRE